MPKLFGSTTSRLLIAALSALVLTLSASIVASADTNTPVQIGEQAPQSRLAGDAGDPLLHSARYWGCERCRNYCYVTWRARCGYSPYCRRSFVLCMRDCWYRFCR